MKSCLHCKYAEWRRNANGSLHRSGDGKCTFAYKSPPLPGSMYWLGPNAPKPCGGFINRRQKLKDHCPYWAISDDGVRGGKRVDGEAGE